MHIPLDREQDVPLYLQIEEALRRAILTGVFVDGDKLPSTRTLAAELAVSRLTVDNAYAELAAKGFLHQQRGSGAYVAHPQAQTRPARPTSDAP
ncbi:winged helix-turn-helix transcriptional regulator, partial [Salmonella enterica subsp. enterica serovar 1,4,[5],12:i:-]|nr:winged helix-turn-helix transcriptional regulator [Salmonella enterica subsp. enterica serovar 1,4,[5],12:i:-]